jgi:hypothetical protein
MALAGWGVSRPASIAHAAVVDPPCLAVTVRITPDRGTLPFTEVLAATVTNDCGETVNATTLTLTDRIRCGSGPWVIDLQTAAGPKTLAPGGALSWWITGEQTGCPSGENGPFSQWLHGQASGTGASTGNQDSGQADAFLNGAWQGTGRHAGY